MQVKIRLKYLKQFATTLKGETELATFLKKQTAYEGEDSLVRIDCEVFSIERIKELQKMVEKYTKSDPTVRSTRVSISAYLKVAEDPSGAKVSNLQSLEEAIKGYIKKYSKKFWIFKDDEDYMLPYLVTSVEYNSGSRDYPAHTDVALRFYETGEAHDASIEYSSEDLTANNVKDLLASKGFYLASEKLLAQYNADFELYKKYVPQIGEQFVSDGYGKMIHSWGSGRESISLMHDGISDKLVNDEDKEKSLNFSALVHHDKFWDVTGIEKVKNRDRYRDEDDEKDDINLLDVPVHPFIIMFNLAEHVNVKVHASSLKPYKYDPALIDKLVLPTDTKELVEILGKSSSDLVDDIVKGKTGGIIVICVGAPGTGKTLTAEVYAEFLKRPLYVVQCSQLGTNTTELEEKLKEVLGRATKWNAILLIDEADVYVHERGKDIQQNAIVGVFLRLLEYYRGILFMTSNRGTIIDDAIKSRATAYIEYQKPGVKYLPAIWDVLLSQFKINTIDLNFVKHVVQQFPNISGRSVKSLIKLGSFMARKRKEEFTLKIVKEASKFAVIEKDELTNDNPDKE